MQASTHDAPRTLADLLAQSVARFGERPALMRLGPRREGTVNYRELGEAAGRAAAGLSTLGIRPGDRVGLVSENGYEWIVSDLGCALAGVADVPRGGESPPKEIRFLLRHSGASAAFFDRPQRVREVLEDSGELPDLRAVVLFEKGDVPRLPGIEVIGFEEFLRGGTSSPAPCRTVPDDLLTIVYTSGTTSDPKGVMLTHANVLSNLLAVPRLFAIEPDDVCLSLLPTWHMFERTVEYAILASGASILYTDPKSARADLLSGRATLFAAVPRVWEMLSCAIEDRIGCLPGPVRGVLRGILRCCDLEDRGQARSLRGFPVRWIAGAGRSWVLPRLRRAAVGRLRAGVSGGASLSPSAERLLHLLRLPVVNGYGLTETSPIVSCAPPSRHRPGTVGPPLPETEVRVVDEGGADLPSGTTGRVLVRGPQVTRGYWRNTEATRRSIDETGWFDTGDLGALAPDGFLSIRGRSKDTIVLSGGEKVEPESIEGALRRSPYVEQAALFGQDRRSLAVLLVPRIGRLQETIPDLVLGDGETIEHPAVDRLLRSEVDRWVAREEGFRPWERPARVAVLSRPFTAAEGTLTATMKLRRAEIQQRYAPLLDRLFGSEAPAPPCGSLLGGAGRESETGSGALHGKRAADHRVDQALTSRDGLR